MDPVNYIPQQSGFLEGYKQSLGMIAQNQEMERARQAQEQAQAQQQQQQQILSDLSQKQQAGTVTHADYENATIAIPGMREHFKQAWDMHSDEEKKASLNEMTQVYSALSSDRPDLATKVLDDRISALKNTGAPQDRIQAVQTMRDNIEHSPDFVRLNTGMMLGAIGAKEAFTGTEEKRKEELQPGAVQKQTGEVKQQAEQLGLTKAETTKALVTAQKLGLENKKLALELENFKKTGGIDPDKKFDMEDKLRKEYTTRTSNFTAMKQHQSAINASAADKSGAGDIALVTSFMKMLDPGSVVRETEFATARDTAGLVAKLSNQAQKLQSGSFLDPKQREDFKRLASQYMAAAEKQQEKVKAGLTKAVDSYGLSADNVFGAKEEPAAAAPTSANIPQTRPAPIAGLPSDIQALLAKHGGR